jgi:hypothetical protein
MKQYAPHDIDVNDALHMIGNDPHQRDVRIIRSPDGGESWSEPVTLFDDSRYHGSATPVHVRNRFVYRAFEDMDRGSASLVVAGDLSKDLPGRVIGVVVSRRPMPVGVQRLERCDQEREVAANATRQRCCFQLHVAAQTANRGSFKHQWREKRDRLFVGTDGRAPVGNR